MKNIGFVFTFTLFSLCISSGVALAQIGTGQVCIPGEDCYGPKPPPLACGDSVIIPQGGPGVTVKCMAYVTEHDVIPLGTSLIQHCEKQLSENCSRGGGRIDGRVCDTCPKGSSGCISRIDTHGEGEVIDEGHIENWDHIGGLSVLCYKYVRYPSVTFKCSSCTDSNSGNCRAKEGSKDSLQCD